VSRAFRKEDDAAPERDIDRPVSSSPNYVTPRGLAMLERALAGVEREGNDREARYYRERISSAIVVDVSTQPRDEVAFGATVRARDASGRPLQLKIVGEDEADPVHGTISWESPVAQAMMRHHAGERVTVIRPAGPINYTIESIAYDTAEKGT
jgi:transcription elongation factor GreB